MGTKPISPHNIEEVVRKNIPDQIFVVINKLIAHNWCHKENKSKLKMSVVIDEIDKEQIGSHAGLYTQLVTTEIKHYVIESIRYYEKEGWEVKVEKEKYSNINFDPEIITFIKKV